MKNINMVCPIGYTGYGITSLNILKQLSLKSNITLFNINNNQNISLNSQEEIDLIRSCLMGQQFYDNEATVLKIWHPHDLAMRPGKGKCCVFPFFELDTLSPVEVHQLNQTDLIFTASDWGKNILQNNGVVTEIVVAPLGVDTQIFTPQQIKSHNNYIFFHIGKWEKRKSQDVVIECFNNAFNFEDNVELWLVPHNPFLNEEEVSYWIKLVQNSKLSDKIKIFPRLNTQYDLARLINRGDCGVFVSRAEGWNNEILETMAINKPVIVTNYSAHTQYCDNNNSMLVNIKDLEKAVDDKWFNGEGNWANIGQIEKESIIEYMRTVYNNNIRSNLNGLETAAKFSWKNTAEIIYANA
jgi:glycosyltransferase involved in cell wall biosynthesis